MTITEKIQNYLSQLPLEKQAEVLDFIEFLQYKTKASGTIKPASLKDHPAFGTWKSRKIDAIRYQQELRAEWGN